MDVVKAIRFQTATTINWIPWIITPLDYYLPPCFRPIQKIEIFFLSETSKNGEILIGLKK